MTYSRLIATATAAFAMCITCSAAKTKKEYPHADIKVGYNYHKKTFRAPEGVKERYIPFVLLANATDSKFFSRKTEYKDSLESTPSGKAASDRMLPLPKSR